MALPTGKRPRSRKMPPATLDHHANVYVMQLLSHKKAAPDERERVKRDYCAGFVTAINKMYRTIQDAEDDQCASDGWTLEKVKEMITRFQAVRE